MRTPLLPRRARLRLARRLRYRAGRLEGLAYRLRGGHPAAQAPDAVLAERVRSVLGQELKVRRLGDVHVDVLDRTVYLRGCVPTGRDAAHVERVARRVPGVDAVESYLVVGPPPQVEAGDTTRLVSAPLARMLQAAREEPLAVFDDLTAVHAVLATFATRIPDDELKHVWAHLPNDLRGLLHPPLRLGRPRPRVRHADAFYAVVARAGGLDAERAEGLSRRVLAELRALASDDADDVAAVLPHELRDVWAQAARPLPTHEEKP